MARTSMKKARRELAKDLALILCGVAIAAALARLGAIDAIIGLLGTSALASFIAGIFFTSAFTLAPASVVLVRIAEHAPFPTVALWGSLGALMGDLILFFFIRDRFALDLERSIRPSVLHHIVSSFHFGFLKWVSPVLGALIIASPLPDELGVALMGFSRARLFVLVPVSFIGNILGIYAIVFLASMV